MAGVQTFTADQDLSAGTLTHTITVGTDTPNVEGDLELVDAMLHAGSAISQTVVVTFISAEGANYTFVLNSETLSSAQDSIYRPAVKPLLKRGDQIKVTCTNSTTPAITVYSLIRLRPAR